jgi:pimeloyl-ACP methyl ester carboxylesterase
MRWITMCTTVWCACAAVRANAPERAPETDRSVISVSGRSYDTVLTVPAGDPIALAVLFGGGSVTDAHWTVPASVDHEGQTIPMTTTGEATRDADAIAAALVARGIAVYQFSTVHRDDAAHEANPGMALGIPFPASREIACAALADATARPRLEGLPVLCIGHSLGAARSIQCAEAEGRVAGLVFLAGAYLSNPRESPSRIEQAHVDALRAVGADLDAGATTAQWTGAASSAPEIIRDRAFGSLDIDGDGALRRWEFAAALHLAMFEAGDRSFEHDRTDLAGEPLPGPTLVRLRLPTLAIFGSTDPMSYHGPMVARAAADAGDDAWLTVEYRHGLGHNLDASAPRTDGHAGLAGPMLSGPIDPDVCRRIADFAAEIAGR